MGYRTANWRFHNWSDFNNFNATDLRTFIDTYILPEGHASIDIHKIRQAIIDYYSAEISSNHPAYAVYQRYTRLLSDIRMIIATLWEVRLKAQLGWPSYIFHFAYASGCQPYSHPYIYPAVGHVGELPFTLTTIDENNSVDRAVRKRMLDAFVKFVKNGEPTADWPRLNFSATNSSAKCTGAMEGYRAAKITGDGVCIESGVRSCGEEAWEQSAASRLDFWDRLSAAYDLRHVLTFPNTQGQCLPTHHAAEGHSSGANTKLSQILTTFFTTLFPFFCIQLHGRVGSLELSDYH